MDGFIAKMVEDLKAQIADLETIDLVISELEDMATNNTSVLHEWTYGKDGEVTAKLINPRAPKIVEEIIGAIKDFYALTEPAKPAPDTDKREMLIITPKEA